MINETKVIQAACSKTYMAKSSAHSLYPKMQGVVFFFFLLSAFLCCYVRLALTPSCGFFFSIFSWYRFRNIPLEPPSPQRSVASILKGEKITYLYFLFSADIQTRWIITCLPSVLPESGIIGLLLLDAIMVIIFISKRLKGRSFRTTEGKAYSDRCIPPAGRKSPELRNGRGF